MFIAAALAGVAAVIRPPAHVDTLHLAWSDGKWQARLVGGVESTSNARAVQTLHDFYRELPQRIPMDSLRLVRLSYGDADESTGVDRGSVQFQLSFALQPRDGSAR